MTQPSHSDLLDVLNEIRERLTKIEDRVLAYDRMRDRIMGAVSAAVVLSAAMWWLIRAKIAAVFGVQQ